LGALCGQTLSPNQFEVLVIDDGSTDDTAAVCSAFESVLPLRYAMQANSGLGAAKNHGIALARAPIVVFLDDDDITESDFLEQHLRTHQDFPQEQYAVLGYTNLSAAVAVSPLMRFVTEIGCHLFSYASLHDGEALDFTHFWGGRSSCKRSLLMKHGVFNPVFRFGAEDIELGYRLSRFGLRVVYNQRAVSHMERILSFDDFCRRCYQQGRSNWVFSRLHREQSVRSWAQIELAVEDWLDIAPMYGQILKVGRDLDRIATLRTKVGLPLDDLTTRLLHRSYYAAFHASRVKGTVEQMQSEGLYIPAKLFRRSSEHRTSDRSAEVAKEPVTGVPRPPELRARSRQAGPESATSPRLRLTRLQSREEFLEAKKNNAQALSRQRLTEEALLQDAPSFYVPGACYFCQCQTRFQVDMPPRTIDDEYPTPNWREVLRCPHCGLNNRLRAAIHILEQEFHPASDSVIYVTEQVTLLFKALRKRYGRVIGSEHLGDEVAVGKTNSAGVRNEDITHLTFADGELDFILSFDVLEHVPDYPNALSEFLRTLRPGGTLFLSVPFDLNRAANLVRSYIDDKGDLVHVLPPEYHGDPRDGTNCLAFYLFGWQLLDELRSAGFCDAQALTYWSRSFCYLGKEQPMLVAKKPLLHIENHGYRQ